MVRHGSEGEECNTELEFFVQIPVQNAVSSSQRSSSNPGHAGRLDSLKGQTERGPIGRLEQSVEPMAGLILGLLAKLRSRATMGKSRRSR